MPVKDNLSETSLNHGDSEDNLDDELMGSDLDLDLEDDNQEEEKTSSWLGRMYHVYKNSINYQN